MTEVAGTQVEVDGDRPLVMVVMEALMVGMEGRDPLAVEEQGMVKMSPSTPSPPGAWARVLGDNILLAEATEEEEEEVGFWWTGRDHKAAATRGRDMEEVAMDTMSMVMVCRGSS